MGKLNGTSMLVVVDGVTIGGTKSFTFNYTSNNPEATTKDSDGATERIYGLTDWDVEFDGLYDPTATFGLEELFDVIHDRTDVWLEMAVIDGTGGGLLLAGYGLGSGLHLTSEMETPIGWSGSFNAKSGISKGTVATS